MLSALIAAVLYGLGCAIFGERFPFSKFNLYSDTTHRSMSAVAVFLADGSVADVWEYHRFVGLSPSEFLAADYPTGSQWVSLELARWIGDHGSEDQSLAPPGSVAVAIGYRCFRIDGDGLVCEDIKVLQEGLAWKR